MKFILSLIVAAMMMVSMSQAAVLNWTASLDSSQEVPSNLSTGTGSATGTIDTVSLLLSWDIQWSGLTGPAIAMHFHIAPVGANGGVAVNIGSISGLSPPSIGSATITSLQFDELMAGNFYINIHTAANPGGEIRGQVDVSPVPLPATGSLMVVALMGLGLVRRQRHPCNS